MGFIHVPVPEGEDEERARQVLVRALDGLAVQLVLQYIEGAQAETEGAADPELERNLGLAQSLGLALRRPEEEGKGWTAEDAAAFEREARLDSARKRFIAARDEVNPGAMLEAFREMAELQGWDTDELDEFEARLRKFEGP